MGDTSGDRRADGDGDVPGAADDDGGSDAVDEDLVSRTRALLEPGDVRLNGVVVGTDLTSDEEPAMHQASIDVGDVVAAAAGLDPAETYVYAGNDDERFGVNQYQGRTIEDDEFVWECQQLLREGTYDLVFYYEAAVHQEAVVRGVDELGFDATGVRGE